MIASIPAFTPDTAAFRVYTPVFDIIFLNGSGNTRTANDPFQLRTGTPNTPTGGISIEDELRFGSGPLTFSVVNDSAPVANLITQALTADSVTVQLVARQSRSPGTVATGGVELDYTAGGVAQVRASSHDGFRPVGTALGQSISVTAPAITLGGTFIGAMLQRGHNLSLSAAAVAGDTVTLRATKPGVMRISPNDSTGFADSIQIAVPAGQTFVSFYIRGVDAVIADTTNLIATIPAFTPDTARFLV